MERQPDDTTVVTWCRWHGGSREVQNVLYNDGVVRPIGREQGDIVRVGNPTGTGTLTSWQRVP